MKIIKSTLADIESIVQLYDMAIAFQNQKKGTPWPKNSKELIETEIREERQYKLIINNEIACIWVYTFNDPEIWGIKNQDSSIYIHRIAAHPKYRGQDLISNVFEWTKIYALKNNLNYIRLDIAGVNLGLINLYKKNGFTYLGTTIIEDPKNLPTHYHNIEVCLLEMCLNVD
ncbi:GNAT family N-acetyltransferase [Aquimarina addita]|uniref:GNAT family N-acetyltransferase n=1 Tax=Aquimarina addita TaxID=870485 RepID=A0ABP6UL71_9FLAO